MRVIALDYGTQNIGVATCDELEITVRPVETIRRQNRKRALQRIKELVEELGAQMVVIGLPLNMDGTAGPAADRVMAFTDQLRGRLNVPVITQDERLTSRQAEELMIEQGLSKDERRRRSDEFAAAIILQDYLSARRVEQVGKQG